MNFLENITFRRTRTTSEPNNDTSEIISHTLDDTTNSMPEMSEDEEDNQMTILKSEIENLKSQLRSAHHEIELLSIENSSLRQTNADLIKKNEMYKKVTSSPLKKKMQTPNRSKVSSTLTHPNNTQRLGTKYLTPNAEDSTINSQKETAPSSNNNKGNLLLPAVKNKHKIHMISSETSNRLYDIIERTHLHNSELCHYRKPKCGLKVLLDGIGEKVKGFTHSDFCIIYIGEDDFRRTHNYIKLVTCIRKALMPLQHTNFVICLPTFKYMKDTNVMYNSRVDIFNNLLCLDVETYNYAYVLDSNYNLPYTHDTYNLFGNLNYKGLRIVLADLVDLILYVSTLTMDQLEADCSQKVQSLYLSDTQTKEESQFFL